MLIDQGQPDGGEPGLLSVDRAGVGHLDAEVVERAALAGVFQQDQLEWWLLDGEVGVAVAALGRSDAEHLV
jgi:hypothetical protein